MYWTTSLTWSTHCLSNLELMASGPAAVLTFLLLSSLPTWSLVTFSWDGWDWGGESKSCFGWCSEEANTYTHKGWLQNSSNGDKRRLILSATHLETF